MSFILFMAIAFGFFWGIEKTKDSAMGWCCCSASPFSWADAVAHPAGGAGLFQRGTLIAMAAGGTGAIFFTLATVATVTKRDFSGIGKFLFVGIVVLLLAMVANIFFQIPAWR